MYDCTTDELVNAYKGKVQNWRIQRALTNLMVGCWVDKGFDITDHIPLPFDDEIGGQDDGEEMLRFYNETVKRHGW